MGKYSKGQQVSYRGQSTYLGKHANNTDSNGVKHNSRTNSGTITSVQTNTVKVSNKNGSSSTVHKNRIN